MAAESYNATGHIRTLVGNWQEGLAPMGGTLGSSAVSAPTFERILNHTDRLVSAAAVVRACRDSFIDVQQHLAWQQQQQHAHTLLSNACLTACLPAGTHCLEAPQCRQLPGPSQPHRPAELPQDPGLRAQAGTGERCTAAAGGGQSVSRTQTCRHTTRRKGLPCGGVSRHPRRKRAGTAPAHAE